MSHKEQAADSEARYRRENALPQIAGGWFCKGCGKQAFSTAGRKRHLSGAGWSCAECVAKRGEKS
jgi:hypothetical protein